MKIGFNLVTKSDTLWARVLHSKYGWKDHLPESINRSHCSHLWRALAKIWPMLRDNLIWSIGDSATVRCWKDPWVPGMGSLISKIPFSSNLDLDCRVRILLTPDGGWNLDLFRIWLPEEVICKIISIPPPLPESNPDRVIWARSSSGAFSIRSAYWALKEPSWNPSNKQWKTIWKYLGPQRVIVFLWLAVQQRLLTNSERVRMGISQSMSCALCGCAFEDLSFALRDCPSAKDVWMRILPEELKQRNTGYAASGGIARDHEGNWIMGFTRFLGVCSPFEAEVWGILDGILILLNKGYRRIRLPNDNLEVIQTLTNLNLEDSGIPILRRTQRIMKAEGVWKIMHIPRNQNSVADHLAKVSLQWKSSLQVFNDPPKDVTDLLQKDKANRWPM
ncbi:hypothetical protein J1N35_027139 [Gossypium stocksii]|uniref:RNase H type-1 domain-containing protein n=1 Tax=Gossypium stocksii TaxID=47602 RepID=A0A9D3VAY4_9ROSI|nr:hypothetical protein J1N35_027139 [Gossypium stocksii]